MSDITEKLDHVIAHGYPVAPRCTKTARYTTTDNGDYMLTFAAFDDSDAHDVFCPNPCGSLVVIDNALEIEIADNDLFRFFADAAQLGLGVIFSNDEINEAVTISAFSMDLLAANGIAYHRVSPDVINEAR